jgi:hypothetical protein
MTRATTAAYVYCVVRAASRPSVARVPAGVPDAARPEAHAVAPSLWLVTAPVPLDAYGSARLESRLRDLDWVASIAVAHEAVVEFFAKATGSTVVPMTLFTMFSTVDKAVRDVASRASEIRRAMRRIAGAEEWGIRVFRQAGQPAAAPASRPASGAAFLHARQQARDATARARRAAGAAADIAFDRLRRIARDARVRDGRREPGTNPPILDAAFLVPRRSRARFVTEARRQHAALGRAGADLVVSGPWPAYNFVAPGEPA